MSGHNDTDNARQQGKHAVSNEELLVPWHVLGLLRADDAEKVDEAAVKEPKIARQMEDALQDVAAVRQSYAQTPSASATAWQNLANRVEALDAVQKSRMGQTVQSNNPVSRLYGWIRDVLPFDAKFVAIAALLVIVAQAGLIGYLVTGQMQVYSTATAVSDTPGEGLAIIRFRPGTTVDEVSTFLDAQDMQVVGGPFDGFYTLALHDDTKSPDQVDAYLSKLAREQTIIAFVGRKTD